MGAPEPRQKPLLGSGAKALPLQAHLPDPLFPVICQDWPFSSAPKPQSPRPQEACSIRTPSLLRDGKGQPKVTIRRLDRSQAPPSATTTPPPPAWGRGGARQTSPWEARGEPLSEPPACSRRGCRDEAAKDMCHLSNSTGDTAATISRPPSQVSSRLGRGVELTEEQVHKAGVDPAHSPGLGPQSWCQGTCPGGPGLGGAGDPVDRGTAPQAGAQGSSTVGPLTS